METQPERTPLSEQVAFWDQRTADAIRAAVYAERQRELAYLAFTGQIELEYPNEN
jgi:hypothetical protein